MSENIDELAKRIRLEMLQQGLSDTDDGWHIYFARRLMAALSGEPVAWRITQEKPGFSPFAVLHESQAIGYKNAGWTVDNLYLHPPAPVAPAQAEMVSVPREPTLEECFAAGKGPDQYRSFRETDLVTNTPAERARFESYMRGHCWSVGKYDDAIQAYDTISVRMLYGVWRDRGLLAAAPNAAGQALRGSTEKPEMASTTPGSAASSIVITRNERNEAIAVTRQDSEGYILETLWERPESERDARRYRLIRQLPGNDALAERLEAACRDPMTPEQFDAAIDAALEGPK